jgi:hypothetical protein
MSAHKPRGGRENVPISRIDHVTKPEFHRIGMRSGCQLVHK